MDAREEMRRWITMVTQQAEQGDNQAIKQGIELLSSAASDLKDQLEGRNWVQADQRKRKGAQTSVKSLSKKAPVKRRTPSSVNRTRKAKLAAQGRSMERTGAKQVSRPIPDPSLPLTAQKNQVRQHIYGRDTPERRLRQAAKALTS